MSATCSARRITVLTRNEQTTCQQHGQLACSHSHFDSIGKSSTKMPETKERLRIWDGVTAPMIHGVLRQYCEDEGVTCLPTHFKELRGNRQIESEPPEDLPVESRTSL